MKKQLMNIFIISILFFFAFCSKSDDNGSNLTPEDLMIRNNEISGWILTGNKWNAASSGDLNNFIDGEAVVYTTRGFVEGSMQEYEGKVLQESVNLVLRIFDQGNEANAKSVFDETVNQMSSPIDMSPKAGKEAKIERVSSMAQRLVFYKSKYFVTMSVSSGSDQSLDVMKTFAINVDTKIK